MPLPDSSDKSRSIEDDNHVSLPGNPALGDTVEEVASTMQDTRKKEDPTRKLRELSKNPKNLDTNGEVEGSYFEKIEMSNIGEDDERLNIDSKKMSELENADLVLVYRDNDSNSRISKALESLVKTKYGGKVYCISIDRHIDHLNDSEKEKFRRILNTCPCLTDHTISEWTGIKTKKFEHELPSDMKNLLDDIKSIETSCMEKKIDTVYIYSLGYTPDYSATNGVNGEPEWVYHDYLTEHSGPAQKEDGTIYTEGKINSETKNPEEVRENVKRFWRNVFTNLNVDFIEDAPYDGSDRNNYRKEYRNNYKTDSSLVIMDSHRVGFFKHIANSEFPGAVITLSGLSFAGKDIKEFTGKENQPNNLGGRNDWRKNIMLRRQNPEEYQIKTKQREEERAKGIAENLFSLKF